MTVPLLQRLRNWWRDLQQQRREARMIERQWVVRFDAQGVAVDHPGGEHQSIAWDEVGLITIDTNDSGPWNPDVWWLLKGNGKLCTFPFGATGEQATYSELNSRFPGLNIEAFVIAMSWTDNARFVCWERKA